MALAQEIFAHCQLGGLQSSARPCKSMLFRQPGCDCRHAEWLRCLTRSFHAFTRARRFQRRAAALARRPVQQAWQLQAPTTCTARPASLTQRLRHGAVGAVGAALPRCQHLGAGRRGRVGAALARLGVPAVRRALLLPSRLLALQPSGPPVLAGGAPAARAFQHALSQGARQGSVSGPVAQRGAACAGQGRGGQACG